MTQQSRHGFTLIQLSVLLVVSGLILSATLPGRDAGDVNQKILDTIAKLDKVESAMQSYMASNGRRPCPADGQYDVNHQYFGVAAGTASPSSTIGGCTGGLPSAPMGADAGTGHIYMGTIPTKTLGIPDEYGLDGWGRRMTYIVDGRATHNEMCYNMITDNTQGDIIVQWKNYSGTIIDTENAMYTYISHGADGHGAWPPQGSTVAGRINRNITDPDSLTNAGINAAFVYNTTLFTNTKIKKDPIGTFDDLVYYHKSTRNQCCIGAACQLFNPREFNLDGESANDFAGTACASLDINADGIDDLVIASPQADPSLRANAGAVYIRFGSTNPITENISLASLDGTNGFKIIGERAGDQLGTTLSVGDFNGDGIDDLAMGGPYANGDEGMVAVQFGNTGTWPAVVDADDYDGCCAVANNENGVLIRGDATRAGYAGTSIHLSDVNDDTIDDLIIGEPGQGTVEGMTYVVFGKNTWTAASATINLATLALPTGIKISAESTADEGLGTAVSSCDMNADGIRDIVISEPTAQVGPFPNAGRVYAIYGKSAGWTNTMTVTSVMNGTDGYYDEGVFTNHYTGRSLACGDVNGDGLEDLAIGAPQVSAGSASGGVVYVQYGSEATRTASVNLNNMRAAIDGFRLDGAANSNTGEALEITDINADGVGDLIIGAPNYDPPARTDAGGAYLYFGKKYSIQSVVSLETAVVEEEAAVIEGEAPGDHAGESVCTTNLSVNRVRNVVLGVPRATATSLANAGRVYNVRGRKRWPERQALEYLP